ncbi:MAG: leucine--tRNA ligase [Ignavibacteria bacterium]|jgi:leucyl-tRNA synthetase|nr:leucine--tRNA ligase [Ignavibacteria bacterium]
MADYKFTEIENKWQAYWQQNNTYKVTDDFSKPKYYILDMFPYPSGAGLHIGHPEGYTATDIVARYKRMKGFNVLHPMGFDAFGLPTERYSMQTGIHPTIATEKNIATYVKQLNMLGFGYDWSRCVNTTDPKYYRWTQWMFTIIYNSWFDPHAKKARHIDELPIPPELINSKEIEEYKDSKRLAYIANIPVNWCAELGTVLANEEVDEWKEKGYTVERKPMRQWMLRITEYAQRLLDDLELVAWPHSTKEMQRNWIGRSIGADVNFKIHSYDTTATVFTTRPDTIFGATYLVLAPEHPLVEQITTDEQRSAVEEYIKTASTKSDLERTELNKTKTGVFTGAFAINPANDEMLPIWIADYVLAHYGTGAIMAVPAHDERDYEFAKTYGLPIKQVVTDKENSVNVDEMAYTEKTGYGINSENDDISLNGLPTSEAIQTAIEWLDFEGIGKEKVQFKLRDWLFSRQRYWGEPMPIMFFEDSSKRCLEPEELPLVLPDVEHFKPANTGESPLANVDSWINFVDKKTGKKARFETNTMPQWAGSCWYYLRYIDPQNDAAFVDKDKEKYWMDGGVDLYVGGAEHAVLHLLYARFWHKVLFDYGYVSTVEPFKRLFHQGLIMGEDGRKMSKSLGNVINPDDVIKEFGADSLRMFEMFLGPLEASKPWSKTGIEGVNRFLNRVWRMIASEDGKLLSSVRDASLTADQEYMLNYTIKKIGDDIENLSFNTCVSQFMIFLNEFSKSDVKPKDAMEKFILCLAPFAPHICSELWQILGHSDSVVLQSYPEFDESKLVKSVVEVVIQVSSKIRSKLSLPLDTPQAEVEALAMKDENVSKYMEGKQVKKVIFVQNKLLNLIVG